MGVVFDNTNGRALEVLEAITDTLTGIENTKQTVLGYRDEAVGHAREAGATWAQINEVCGTANMQVTWERHRKEKS